MNRAEHGPEYIVPKPFDPRALLWTASAVARPAMESEVARPPVIFEECRQPLNRLAIRVMGPNFYSFS